MDMIEFQEKFSTEEQWREYLFSRRWPKGFRCPKCGHTEHFNVQSRNLYQCKACLYQASVTAGTILDKTRTPLVKWFMAMYLMAEDKRGISALSLKKRIGVAYQTAWTMCHKIRHAMGTRDGGYNMSGVLEMDESFFGSPTEGGKRGRGTDKTAVLISVSHSGECKPRYAMMKVVEKVSSETVKEFSDGVALEGSEIRTDGLRVYKRLTKGGYLLNQKNTTPKDETGHLHWAHVVISNAKAFISGTFHGLDAKHLQRYLDEFCYRFNRRFFPKGIFPRLVNACLSADRITIVELIG